MWNGPWWKAGCVFHYCNGCCRDLQDTTEKLVTSAKKILFRRIVPDIAANKWTKLGPVLDWLLMPQLCDRVLGAAFLRLGLGEGSQRGTIDGAITGFQGVQSQKMYEVADFLLRWQVIKVN